MNTTTATEAATATKAPPAWMKRAPMSRDGVASALNNMAEACVTAAEQTADRDVKAGLAERAVQIARAAKAVRAGHCDEQACARMQDFGAARLACAKATTETNQRAAYMDDAHTFREAFRLLDPR